MGVQTKLNSKPQGPWTPSALSLLTFVSQQRALRLDHVPRYLALVEGNGDDAQQTNLKSTAHNLIERLHRAGLIHMQSFGKSQPDWIWLTRSGLQVAGTSSSWKRPARSALPALHAANTIRLLLTMYDRHAGWISRQQLRRIDPDQRVYPTAEWLTSTGGRIAIHVVLRLTGTPEQIATRMRQQLERKTSLGRPYYAALWYYATADAAKLLRAARARMNEGPTQGTTSAIWIFAYPLIRKLALYREHHCPVRSLGWSPDGTRVASAGKDAVHVWEATTGKEIFRLPVSVSPSLIRWSLHGSWIALGDEGGNISLWDGTTGILQHITTDHLTRITGLAWSPLNDDLIASCSVSGRLQVDDTRHHTLLWTSEYLQGVEAFAWSPDGGRLAAGGHDACVHLFDATTGRHLHTYRKHRAAVQALAWSPDSQQLASASDGPAILIWDASSGKRWRTIMSSLASISVLAWSPDGTRLAAAGSDPCVQVWQVSTGRLLLTYEDHADAVTDLAWSPDSSMLASASSDGTVQVYLVARGSQ